MADVKDEKKANRRSRVLRSVSFFMPALLGLIIYYLNSLYLDTIIVEEPSTPSQQLSYREACLSGKYSSLKDLHPFVTEYIEEVQGALTKDRFIDDYLWRGKPVMMRGAAKDWPAHKRWTDEYLQDKFYDMTFYVDLRKHHSTDHAVRTKMKLGKFLSNYKKKDWYLDSMTTDARFLDETHVPQYLNISGIFDTKDGTQSAPFFHNFYLSGGDTNSPLHYDGYDNLLTSLDGTKEWIIAEPEDVLKLQIDEWIDHANLSPLNVTNFNVSNHLGLCDVRWRRAIVTAGDTLFIPTRWPHHVYSPPSRNMAIGMWFYLDDYMDLIKGFDDDVHLRNHTAKVPLWVEHVKTRPHPCNVTSCKALPPGNLRTLLPDHKETYSRDSDVPPAHSSLMELAGDRKVRIPTICYGTGLPAASITNPYLNTKAALNMGYKLIDTAQHYGNEREVGAAVRDCKWIRKSVIVMTKFELALLKVDDVTAEVTNSIELSLNNLGLDYIDILLIHDTAENSLETVSAAWRAMEAAVSSGKVRAIGLSNTDIETLRHIFYNVATVPVSTVQNLYAPIEFDKEVVAFCAARGIIFMGFGVTGAVHALWKNMANPVTESPLIKKLAELYHTSPHIIAFNWAAQNNVVPIIRSTSLGHMRDNLDYADVYLTPAHMQQINQMVLSEEEIRDVYGEIVQGAE